MNLARNVVVDNDASKIRTVEDQSVAVRSCKTADIDDVAKAMEKVKIGRVLELKRSAMDVNTMKKQKQNKLFVRKHNKKQ